MRTAVQWVLSLTSSARPSTSGPRQAAQNLSEPNENVETFRDKSRGPAPLASHGQESTVNPGTEATGDHLQTSSCPVVGQLGNGRQAILPTFSEEGSSNYRQSHAEDLQSIPEDVQSLSPVDKQASAEVQGSTPEEGQPKLPGKRLLRKQKQLADKTAKAEGRTETKQKSRLQVMAWVHRVPENQLSLTEVATSHAVQLHHGVRDATLDKRQLGDAASMGSVALQQDPAADFSSAAAPASFSAKDAAPQQGPASGTLAQKEGEGQTKLGGHHSKASSTGKGKGKGKSHAKNGRGASAPKKPLAALPPRPKPVPAKAPRKGIRPGVNKDQVLSIRDAQEEDEWLAAKQAATPAPLPPPQDDDGLEDLIKGYYRFTSAPAAGMARSTAVSSGAKELRCQQAQRFAEAQALAVAAYQAAIRNHPAELFINNNPNNIQGALDSPSRQLACLTPRHQEQRSRPKEVWKLDLHTSQDMRDDVRMIMTAELAADAMALWLQVLTDHLVPWVRGGWVTVVTGRGRGCNHAECQVRLAVMKELNQVADYQSAAQFGAIYVQLKAPSKGSGPQGPPQS